MKIAIIGTRGVPAMYGGFETCAEELAVRLVERGHEVIVYCRKGNYDDNLKEYKGVKLIHRSRIKTKVLDTISNTFFSMIHVVRQKVDVIFVMNAANSPLCLIPKLFGKKIAINVDGLEWKRKKWGTIAKTYYRFSEYLATKICDEIVSDSTVITQYYLDTFKTPSTFIAYGANIENSERPEIIKEYNLEKDEYFFIASRLEPENNADLTIKAFEGVKTDKKLVIAGGANYKSDFIKDLEKTKDERIIFLGPVYTDGHIKELHCNCYAYVHGNEVGGTNPALLKAMGYGNAVLSFGVSYNKEVIADSAVSYERSVDDLREKMQRFVDNPEEVKEYRVKAVERIKEAYTWKHITDEYEKLFIKMASK